MTEVCTSATSLELWAKSGLMALTGPANEPPLPPARDYAGRIEHLLRLLKERAAACGSSLPVDMRLLTERAALLGLERRGRISPGGACRLMQTRDGWLAVNLARDSDFELLPAWIGSETGDLSWEALEQAALGKQAAAFASRGQMLGIPAVKMKSRFKPAALQKGLPVRFKTVTKTKPQGWISTPLVLDFSSLWAGPLCGNLLTLGGARVIKVESTKRPDGARKGNIGFFNLLHGGQESLALDFTDARDRQRLLALMHRADIIIEASRPRAFEQLGFLPSALFAENPRLIWLSMTAYGREGAWRNRVGFGDDVAAAAGLIAEDPQGRPCFMGDAIADPLTGIAAAGAVYTALSMGGGMLIDAAMVRIAAYIATAPEQSAYEMKNLSASLPLLLKASEIRKPIGIAPALGQHTDQILREFA